MPEVQDISGQGLQPDPSLTYEQLLKKIQGTGIAGNIAQQKNIDANKAMQQQIIDQPNQINLQPLMALSDQLYGTKYAQSYQAPVSPEQKQATIAKLQEEVMKSTGQMSDEQTKLLKAQLETLMHKEEIADRTQTHKENQAIIAQNEATKRGDKLSKEEADFQAGAQNAWQHDTIAQADAKTVKEVDRASSWLEKAHAGNSIARQQLKVIMAKLIMESGRINVNEIEASGSSDKLRDKVGQMIDTTVNGKLSDTNYAYIKELVDDAKMSSKTSLASAVKQHAGQFVENAKTALGKDIPMKDAIRRLTGGTFDESILKDAPDPTETAGNGGNQAPPPEYKVGQIVPDSHGNPYKYLGGPVNSKKSWAPSTETATQPQPQPVGP